MSVIISGGQVIISGPISIGRQDYIGPPVEAGMANIQSYFAGTNYALYDFRPGANSIYSDTSCSVPIKRVGVAIAGVKDLGNYGRNLTQETEAQRPISDVGASFGEATYSYLSSSSSSFNVATAVVVAKYMSTSDSYGGMLTNQLDGGSGVDFVFTKDGGNSYWDAFQAAGGALATNTRIWNNKSQTINITYGSFACYSADGTSFPGTLAFPNGLRVGIDRPYTSRKMVGVIQSMFITDTILSTTDRNWLEDEYSSIFSLGF